MESAVPAKAAGVFTVGCRPFWITDAPYVFCLERENTELIIIIFVY